MGFLTEWLVSFRNGLGSHCGAALALPELANETSWVTVLGFGASDAAMHSPSVFQNNRHLQEFAHLTKMDQCNIN